MPRPLALEAVTCNPDGSDGQTFSDYTTSKRRAGARVGSFTTKIQTGFEACELDLFRDQRRPDGSPRLLQELRINGVGKRAWEGRITAIPVDRNDNVQATGYWDGLQDTDGVSEPYVDSDISSWGDLSSNEKQRLLTAGSSPDSYSFGKTGGALFCEYPASAQPLTEAGAMYTAPPGSLIAKVVYTGAEALPATGTAAAMYFYAGDSFASEPAVSITLDATERTATAGTASRYVVTYAAMTAGTPATGRYRKFTSLKVYGDHGLTNIYASEVIKHAVGKYCPLLSATSSTIQDTTYAIGQLLFDGATVADVVQRCNAFHLWRFMVWEGRKCYFGPQLDLTDYDYEIPFQGEYRGSLNPAGPALDDDEPLSGAWVYYTDVQTGRRERVGPYGASSPYDTAGDSSLLVTAETNACVRADQQRFKKLDISFNCTRADAILMGSVWLAEKQTKVNAGTGTAQGYVKNRAGALVPAWEIRAGDRVRYSHQVNTIREVYATSYDPSTYVNSLTFEKPDSTFDGINERTQMALQAANLA